MSVDLYEPRRMIAALEQRKIPFRFFLDTFFREEDISETDNIDIDIDRGGQRIMAAFVNPKLPGQNVERRGFKTRTYKPPYVKPKRTTEVDDVLKRSIGENVYNAMSPMIRAGRLLGKDLGELDDLISRREEWMAANALQLGQITVEGEGVSDTIDFDMLTTHTIALSGTARWSQYTTAKPLTNLRDYCIDLIQEDSGLVPTVVVFGRSAWDDFMQCEQIIGGSTGRKSLFDLRAIETGRIDPRPLAAGGVTYQGYLQELNLDLYTYAGRYWNDSTKTSEWLMHPDKILIGCTDARCVRHYGLIKDLKMVAPLRRFAKSWEEEDPSARFVMVQSAPLMANHQPDAFVCVTVR